MVNPSKAKGTAAETACKRHAQANGFPLADRLTLSGQYDRGDLQLTVGVIAEVKAGAQAKNASRGQIDSWLEETETERVNAGASIGLLIVQPRGIGTSRPGLWSTWFLRGGDLAECAADAFIFNYPICVTFDHALLILRAAGWGTPIGGDE